MRITDFDYKLPPELIAQEPLPERAASRMLVVDRARETWTDSEFALLPQNLKSNDTLVLNNTRVFPARLEGQRADTGGAVELLLVREVAPDLWEALARPGRRLRQGTQITFRGSELQAEVIDVLGNGMRRVKFESSEVLEQVIDAIGGTPLPPYIKRETGRQGSDKERYQTIYASQRGAIAAPTAGLHFTSEVLGRIRAVGTRVIEITLHVGYGTFEPVRVEELEHHRVAPEWTSISEKAAAAIEETRSRGGRIISVGTTTARALESAATSKEQITPGEGFAALTVVPGYKFRVVDALLTNFHLPQSSLLVLVSAFAGRDLILNAYRHAVAAGYRFYSYGDCMLIL
jgi:S-adenosylmethionine:tRNA ribosyltransferase-isomerase